MPPVGFSRIALAAALLEYDNDPDDPTSAKRSAQDSAIFSHLRRSGPVTKPQSVLEYDDLPEPRRSKDYLHIPLPGDDDAGLMSPTSPQDANFGPPPRRSRDGRRSLDVLQQSSQGGQFFNNAEGDDEGGSEGEGSMDDVDLTSWGLDSIIGGSKTKAKDKVRPSKRPGPAKLRPASQHLDDLPNPHSPQEMEPEDRLPPTRRRPSSARRSNSLFGDEGLKNLFLDQNPPATTASTFPLTGRRHTVALTDDFGEMITAPLHPPRSQSAAGMLDPASVPFPGSPGSPGAPGSRPGSALDMLDQAENNVFEVPLPPPERISKFDPKAARHSRTLSGGSWLSTDELNDARKRAQSNASMGSRGGMLDAPGDGASAASPSLLTGAADAGNRLSQIPPPSLADTRRLSRMELMRPKVLIMPSPLRDRPENPDPLEEAIRRRGEGFENSTGDRPLPANFRASSSMNVATRPGPRPLGGMAHSTGALAPGGLGELLAPVNPRQSLSATQLMFRNNLLVGGERDVSYQDIEGHLQRAHEDGEKIDVYAEDAEMIEAEYREMHRPTGKLLGTSLMDALEARKQEIKGKRRVFTGDDRPSMMERSTTAGALSSTLQSRTKSTLIDPSSFSMPQIAVVDGDGRPIVRDEEGGLIRRGTTTKGKRASSGPLLNLGGGDDLSPPGRPGGMKTRGSVFGVDTLWEKEVSKLERMKQAEQAENNRQSHMDSAKSRGGDKGKRKMSPLRNTANSSSPPKRESVMPVLPDIPRVSTSGRPKPMPADYSDDEDGEFGVAPAHVRERRRVSTATLGVKGWFAGGSSDEEDDRSRRTPDSRALTPNSNGNRASAAASPNRLPPVADDEDDEDEDLPLVAKINQFRASGSRGGPPPPDDSDEDEPLAQLKSKPRASASGDMPASSSNLSAPPINAKDGADDESEEEDNVPLGLRASTMFPSTVSVAPNSPGGGGGDEDEDEKPLGLRYSVAPNTEQQQYSAMLQQQQQQQQQQQMYMQHMARGSMASFSGMGQFGMGGFMGPQMTGGSMGMGMPMGMGMGMPMGMPMALPTPPMPNPADTAKITRVDAWRKGVAGVAEG